LEALIFYEREKFFKKKIDFPWIIEDKKQYFRGFNKYSKLDYWSDISNNPYLKNIDLENIKVFQLFFFFLLNIFNKSYFYSLKNKHSFSKIIQEQIKELKRDQNKIMNYILKLEKKIDFLEHKIKLKSLQVNLQENQEFIDQEKWLFIQKQKFPDEIIAYMKKNDKIILIGHAKSETLLLEEINKLIQNNELSKDDIIYFE